MIDLRRGTITGSDVELAKKVLEDVGISDVRLIETEFPELLPGLSDGRWRMTTGLFGTDERRKLAAFSRPIWALSDGLLVRQGNPIDLNGYRSLAGSRCGDARRDPRSDPASNSAGVWRPR